MTKPIKSHLWIFSINLSNGGEIDVSPRQTLQFYLISERIDEI
jgi:hypothetical protein